LRDDEKRRDHLKLLFDSVDAKSIKSDLEKIINDDCTLDWRRYFIKRGEILDVCGYKKFIRWVDENNILLLETSRTNGLHSEYYSYALNVKLKKLGNIVEYISQNSVYHLKYISSINYREVQIAYQYNSKLKKWQYRFGQYESVYQYFDTEEEIIDYLYKNKYIKTLG
jgi:hypothetical protein